MRKSIKKLFDDRDINIPVTIFSETIKKGNSYAYKQAWYHIIKESVFQTLDDSCHAYHFQITSINGKVYTLHCTGAQLMDELHSLFSCKAPLSIRIDVLENSDISLIIILKDDL